MVTQSGELCAAQQPLSVEVIDQVLDRIAATNEFSAPELRQNASHSAGEVTDDLIDAIRRMRSVDVKWLIRMVLKDMRPATLPDALTMHLFHPSLQAAFHVRRSVVDAVGVLPADKERGEPQDPQTIVNTKHHRVTTRTGTMIDLPRFEKARSIRHCCSLPDSAEVSVERKYDGEYCQIHVSVSDNDGHDIKIFSKSGRDSTMDRHLLLDAIKRCLGLGTSDCRLRHGCISVGELLVWSDETHDIMPFYKIRRHVTRAGRRLGCAQDSPASPEEHLMIVLHDLLLLDDVICIYEPYERRRRRLEGLIRTHSGHAQLGHRKNTLLRGSNAEAVLAKKMAHAIAQNWEGLVFKSCDDPYITTRGGIQQHIKLKKDYIPGLGDSADLVVVGGRRVAIDVYSHGLGNLSWTTFYLACLENKQALTDPGVKPIFRIMGQVCRPAVSIKI